MAHILKRKDIAHRRFLLTWAWLNGLLAHSDCKIQQTGGRAMRSGKREMSVSQNDPSEALSKDSNKRKDTCSPSLQTP